ncbi:MAG: sulfite exporter TauE/SafE family protein [Pseudomonadota bacterium]
MEITDLIIVTLGIALGGFIKGATGAGAPVVGVPIVAIVLGVPMAVAIFAVLNMVSNTWQAWAYSGALADRRFVGRFALAGALGVLPGTILLARLPTDLLMAGLAVIVFLYIGLRVARPTWRLARADARTYVGPVGFAAGVMQGAGGISAPASVTFLNAMRLERAEFVGTIAVFFLAMSVTQVPSLIALGILDWPRIGLGLLAVIPLFGAMPLGAAAARRVSRETFDKLILGVLAVVALRLIYNAIGG